MLPSRLHIVPSHSIDAAKWDACVVNCKDNVIYATHQYLEHMADNWLGIIINDYEAVMPVIWRSKWGVRYTYTAPFIQQLGMFGSYTPDDFKNAVAYITKHFRYGDLYFNAGNDLKEILPDATTATNLIIPLKGEYQMICKQYNKHLQTKLKQAGKQSLQYVVSDEVALAAETYRHLYAQRLPAITTEIFKRFTALALELFKQEQCFVRQVKDAQNNLLAIALFLKDNNRIYNILPSVTGEGKKLNAMHFLLDNVLQEFACTHYTFDFEGSDVPGIEAFYQSFGAVNEPYFFYHYNRLPFPLKWLKR